MKVKMVDVARRLGVSKATVSLAVNGEPELYEGKIRIPMGAKQYMAVRMKAVE